MDKNKELRKAALEIIEGRRNVTEAELLDGDCRYTTVLVDGVSYKIYMVGTDECFDMDEFYQYGITDNNRLLKFYFDLPDDDDFDGDLSNVDYSQAYRVIDVTGEWDYTDLGVFLDALK